MSNDLEDASLELEEEEEKSKSGSGSGMTVPSLSSLCFPPIQISSLRIFDVTNPMPVSLIGAYANGASDDPMKEGYGQQCSSTLKARRAKHRTQILYKMGLKSHWIDEKKLMSAVQNSELSKVSELLEQGVNPNICDQKKRTPLHIAASQGHDYIVGLLLSKRGDPNRQDILGNTPLHLAVCRGDLATVKVLIENGSNIFISDNAGRTPLSLVRNRLGGLRRNKTTSTDAFKTEFILMSELLCSPATRQHDTDPFVTSIDDLCNQMQTVSTRERADEIADAAIRHMVLDEVDGVSTSSSPASSTSSSPASSTSVQSSLELLLPRSDLPPILLYSRKQDNADLAEQIAEKEAPS